MRLWRSGEALRFCISTKFSDVADAFDTWATYLLIVVGLQRLDVHLYKNMLTCHFNIYWIPVEELKIGLANDGK